MDAEIIPRVQLSDGSLMPIIGLGTWQSEPKEVYKAVKEAIRAGYRHFDCASFYANETEVGMALNEALNDGIVKRQDLYVVDKVWPTFFTRDRVKTSIKKSLSALGLDYIDLYLIHWPMSFAQVDDDVLPKDTFGNIRIDEIDFVETWRGMEDCVNLGLTKSIGVSNFNSFQIKRILKEGTIKPVVNQVECSPFLAQKHLIKFCSQRGILITAYSPLGNPGSKISSPSEKENNKLLEEPKVIELAKKYKKSAAQILIKFQVQRGVAVVPKSVHKNRIISNINVFDFDLTKEEIEDLESLDRGHRTCHFKIANVDKHKNYPFHYIEN